MAKKTSSLPLESSAAAVGVAAEAIARFPHALEQNVTHPSSRQWAGSVGNHVYIIALEGDLDRPQADAAAAAPR